jgi:hypothetical protein
MYWRSLLTILSAALLFLSSFCLTPTAEAVVPITISDVSYTNCSVEFAKGNVTSGGNTQEATCYMITGKAINKSGKTLYDADVFGRIYDANNEPVLQNRSRVGSLAEVPPGESEFQLRISVPSNQPTPLKLKQFKANGFSSHVYPAF